MGAFLCGAETQGEERKEAKSSRLHAGCFQQPQLLTAGACIWLQSQGYPRCLVHAGSLGVATTRHSVKHPYQLDNKSPGGQFHVARVHFGSWQVSPPRPRSCT